MINFVGPVVPPSTDPNNYQPSMIDWLRLCGQMAHNCLGTVCIADVDSVSFGLKLPISALSTTNTWAEFRCVFLAQRLQGALVSWIYVDLIYDFGNWVAAIRDGMRRRFHYMKVRSRNAITLYIYIYHWIFLEIIYDHICICLYASSLSSMKEDRHSKTSKLLAELLFGVSHPGRSLICDVATIKHLGMLTFGR